MKTLAVDTSSNVATVAVMDEDRLICEYILNHKTTHSQKLMPMIKEVLESCELTVNDIHFFSVALGPGSFTGLRIGVATVKTMAHAMNKPVVGVSTLDALAFGITYFEGIICPILDAKRDQVYTALYNWKNGSMERISEYMALSIDKLIELLKLKNENVIFLGDGTFAFRDILIGALGDFAHFSPVHSLMQRASLVAELALKRFKEGQRDDCMTLVPFYLRKSQAERALENAKPT